MHIKKLNRDEFEDALESFKRYSKSGFPLLGELHLAPEEVDDEVKISMEQFFNGLEPTSAFSFLYTSYGEPTIGHQENELFTYSFYVADHLVSVTGRSDSVSFRMFIPPKKMSSFWEKQQTVEDSIERALFEKGIPLMNDDFNLKRLLNDDEQQINIDNLITYAERVLENPDFVFFSHVIRDNPPLEENQFEWYRSLRWKVYSATAEEVNKEFASQMFKYPVFENCAAYAEAKALFMDFCKSIGTEKIRFGRDVLTIRGFEQNRRPTSRKREKNKVTEDDSED